MSKIRVVGHPIRNNSVNATHQQMISWLLSFEGCMFTQEDWRHFMELARKKAAELNGRLIGGKPSPNRIDLRIDNSEVRVDYHNSNTAACGLEMVMYVIEIKSEYNRTLGRVERYLPFHDDSSEKGGAV